MYYQYENIHQNGVIISMSQLYEEYEDIKGVNRIRKSKKIIQHNGQKKKYKDLQNIHIKQKIE